MGRHSKDEADTGHNSGRTEGGKSARTDNTVVETRAEDHIGWSAGREVQQDNYQR